MQELAIDWTPIYEKYKGQWVTLKDDEETVISSGTTAKEALEKARAKGYNDPILAKMPLTLDYFVGNEIQI